MAALFASRDNVSATSQVEKRAVGEYAAADNVQEASYKGRSCEDAYNRCRALPMSTVNQYGKKCYESWKACEQTGVPTIFPGGTWVPSRPK